MMLCILSMFSSVQEVESLRYLCFSENILFIALFMKIRLFNVSGEQTKTSEENIQRNYDNHIVEVMPFARLIQKRSYYLEAKSVTTSTRLLAV